MIKFPPLFAAAVVVFFVLAGCATTSSQMPPPPPYLAQLEKMGVAPATLDRIANARVLGFEDVLELVRRGVPGDRIVAYLRSTRAPYNFTQPQINALVRAGADSTLVNFVGRDAGDFLIDAQNENQQARLLRDARFRRELWQDPYFTDPTYAGAPPFDYVWPALWY